MNAWLCLALTLTPLLLSTLAHAGSLQVWASAGDSAAVVATCLQGSYPYGTDLRGCTDESGQVFTTNPSASFAAAAHATYVGGMSGQAQAYTSFGTLKAFAQTTIPSADNVGHNLQSRATAQMQDTLVASSAYGALYNNYSYSVNITGNTTPSTPYGMAPSSTAFAYVSLDIAVANTGAVLVSRHWETDAASLGGGSIIGSIVGVPADTVLQFTVYIEADAWVGTNATGQAGFARTDYSNTVHFYFDALTPGANTLSASGHDYALAAAVPEPPIVWTLGVGLGLLAWRRRRQQA